MPVIVHVRVHVKPDRVGDFRAATIENATRSVRELGVARFDVLQQADDPTSFLLNEVYRSAEAAAAHKETAHYRVWRDTVADMMLEARSSVKFTGLFPPDDEW